MKVVQINATCGVGSTGKICVGISQLLTQKNIENYVLFSQDDTTYPLGIKYSGKLYAKYQALKSRITGKFGFTATYSTKKLIKHLERIQPNAVILHNLHSHNVNLAVLFKYFKLHPHIKLFWVFHDCWAVTGYCTHFIYSKCEKWKKSCYNCSKRKEFSWFFDKSTKLYEKKKQLFSDLNLEIITPSKWLKEIVEQSMFKEYKVTVINNGIDLNIFKPTPSDFRKKYGIEETAFVLLGVAFDWGVRKGLDVFVELSKKLDKEKYKIVLVGTDEQIDSMLPSDVISIHKTKNQLELAEIYTTANLFVNPTREDTYPTVNMEALACGTPVVTFDTGGSPEIIDITCGSVVPLDDLVSLESEIVRICENNAFSEEDCLARSKEFDLNKRYGDYLKLFGEN